MMKQLIIILLALSTVNCLYGQSKEDMARLEAFKKQVNTPVVFKARSSKGILIKRNLVYNSSDTGFSKMNVYLPGNKKIKPLVILIHGKTPIPTHPKEWGVYESWGMLLASEEFVTVVFNNSLAIPGKSLEQAGDDLELVITTLKSKSTEFNIDTSRIALFSFSAGAPLLNYPFIKKDKNVKALVSFYGFLGIDGIKLYGDMDPATVAKFSLVNYTDSDITGFPPIFIAQAGKERNTGLNQSINSFVNKASLNNIPVTFFNHPSGVHGFDNQNDDSRSREIIQGVLTFLHAHL
jgi:acetyl esterase/lipase